MLGSATQRQNNHWGRSANPRGGFYRVLGARVTGGPAQSRPYLLQTAATSPTHENSISRFNLTQGCFHFFPLSNVLHILFPVRFIFSFSLFLSIFQFLFLLSCLLNLPHYSLRTTNVGNRKCNNFILTELDFGISKSTLCGNRLL